MKIIQTGIANCYVNLCKLPPKRCKKKGWESPLMRHFTIPEAKFTQGKSHSNGYRLFRNIQNLCKKIFFDKPTLLKMLALFCKQSIQLMTQLTFAYKSDAKRFFFESKNQKLPRPTTHHPKHVLHVLSRQADCTKQSATASYHHHHLFAKDP